MQHSTTDHEHRAEAALRDNGEDAQASALLVVAAAIEKLADAVRESHNNSGG